MVLRNDGSLWDKKEKAINKVEKTFMKIAREFDSEGAWVEAVPRFRTTRDHGLEIWFIYDPAKGLDYLNNKNLPQIIFDAIEGAWICSLGYYPFENDPKKKEFFEIKKQELVDKINKETALERFFLKKYYKEN